MENRFWINKRNDGDDQANSLVGWYAVVDDDSGIIAYFHDEKDAIDFCAKKNLTSF